MKKHIVLSVNDNQDYLYFTPLVIWAWRYFGWEPILFYHRTQKTQNENGEFNNNAWIEELLDKNGVVKPYFLNSIEGYRSDTITQISRLYGCMVIPFESYLMTGDIDMLPLSDYWKVPEQKSFAHSIEAKPTVWGHDLTGFVHYPICYIGMYASHWRIAMKLHKFEDMLPGNILYIDFNAAIKRDLDTLPQAKDSDFYKYWFSDQDLITARLNEYGKEKINFINRGQGNHGYARGRVDRGAGGWVLNQPELIDAHLEQQTHHSIAKIERLYALLAHVWPSEDFTWFKTYTEEYRRLTGHTA